MVGVCKINIQESKDDLRLLLAEQKTASGKERVQLLYLLKSGQVKSVSQAAQLMGRNRVTLERWLGKYRQGGLHQLLSPHSGRGRKRHIPAEVDQKLQQQLQQTDGFDSYGEIQQWLKQQCQLAVSYPVVHLHVRYRLKAKLKVPRPVSAEQQPPQVAAFQKPSLPELP
ncbi:helix-turn-helix domain-containing protein [Leptolyngbya sp. FACHB-711]|uniref:helix-turn-helix domain-containing protein n=1 Tax=Leptolyngbya sp. FACHB-711 TaxID=2692813 RepID=UPI0018F0055E|nr:helix-turn-helix domain-containing protein [Leptolyngbya sp. FACHB-711]